jgi:tetratricopeptide (TPR) repeat protein
MYEKAIYNYEKAGSLATKGVKKYIYLALSYAYLSDDKKAEGILQEGIKVDTAFADKHLYYYNLGWLKNKQQKPDEAIRWYKKSVTQKPSYPDAYNNLGYIYDRQGKKDSAVYWYKQCLKADPDYTRAMYNLAYIYNDIYKYDSSLYYYKMLYRLVPLNASVAYEIGLSYYYSYDYDSSIVYLERALTLNNKT